MRAINSNSMVHSAPLVLRDFDLAAKVARLPDSFLIGPPEISSITGFAVSSLRNPAQRARLGMPEPLAIRHLRWSLGSIRDWLGGPALMETAGTDDTKKIGRPTKATQVAIARQAQQSTKGSTKATLS
ncbi:MAG: hypothetical protein P4L96_09460 [Rhodoferax sp.]|nr:hypothetical protein [Rhodoferax sp.]